MDRILCGKDAQTGDAGKNGQWGWNKKGKSCWERRQAKGEGKGGEKVRGAGTDDVNLYTWEVRGRRNEGKPTHTHALPCHSLTHHLAFTTLHQIVS